MDCHRPSGGWRGWGVLPGQVADGGGGEDDEGAEGGPHGAETEHGAGAERGGYRAGRANAMGPNANAPTSSNEPTRDRASAGPGGPAPLIAPC